MEALVWGTLKENTEEGYFTLEVDKIGFLINLTKAIQVVKR